MASYGWWQAVPGCWPNQSNPTGTSTFVMESVIGFDVAIERLTTSVYNCTLQTLRVIGPHY